eukprot:4066987-Pyramimonas_sp.AAC.1
MARRARRAFDRLQDCNDYQLGVWIDFAGFHEFLGKLIGEQFDAEERGVRWDGSISQTRKSAYIERIRSLAAAWAPAHRRVFLRNIITTDGESYSVLMNVPANWLGTGER